MKVKSSTIQRNNSKSIHKWYYSVKD